MKRNADGSWAGMPAYGPLLLLLVVLFFLSCLWGRYPIPPLLAVKVIASKLFAVNADWPASVETVLFKVRLPRITAAILIGGGLSVSGAAFQGLFRNPLVSPYILGVASGAGFGASLAILLLEKPLIIQASAFVFGLLAVTLSYGMTRLYRASSLLVLVLAGVIMGAFFSALTSLIKFWADPFEKLPLIVFWLMGSLATINRQDVIHMAIPMFTGISALFLIRWKINILSLGEEEAKALGVETVRLRILIVTAATLITASAVAVSGIIGWVGLVIPHLARMIYGPNYRKVIPASFLLGGCYLLFIDNVARNLTASEVPLGILTATIGAPAFALVLRKSSLGWQ